MDRSDTHPPGYFRAEADWLSPPDEEDDGDNQEVEDI